MGTELTNYDALFAEQAKQAMAENPVQSGAFFSLEAGMMTLNEQRMPGDQVICVIIDSFNAKTLYPPGAYVKGQAQTPICYAYGRGGEEMSPFEGMRPYVEAAIAKGEPCHFQPQHFPCVGCQWNEFGSADTGKGKACKDRVQLTLLPAGEYRPRKGSRDFDTHLYDDPAYFMQADVAFMNVPTTSIREYSSYVSQVALAFNRPPHGVVTRIYTEPDAKTQFKVKFEVLAQIPDEIVSTIMERHRAARATPYRAYQPPEVVEAAKQNTAIAGLRRPGA